MSYALGEDPESDTAERAFDRRWYGWRTAHSVSVGNVNRNDPEWNANVNRLGNDGRWNAGNRLLVRNKSLFLPLRGSFLLEIRSPADEHFARVN